MLAKTAARLSSFGMPYQSASSAACSSTEVVGNNCPDPVHTVKTPDGLSIPLGVVGTNPKTERKRKGGQWSYHYYGYPAHNEFITYKDEQAALKYLIKFSE